MNAIAGTFSDIKTIKSRSVVQLCIEVPIERADEALSILGGVPQPGRERWVGIAPIPDQERAAHTSPGGTPVPEAPKEARPAGAEQAPKSKRRWSEMPIATRAALICSDPNSWPVLAAYAFRCRDLSRQPLHDEICNELIAADWLRQICGVRSRAHITPDNPRYRQFETEYMRATGRIASPA